MRSLSLSAHFADVFAVAPSRNASKEELRTRTLPAIHPGLTDVLDGVPRAGFRFTLNVKRADAWRHERTARASQIAHNVIPLRLTKKKCSALHAGQLRGAATTTNVESLRGQKNEYGLWGNDDAKLRTASCMENTLRVSC
jgi:hypothetical protein